MFVLGVELLMRRAVISRWDSREEPEWPPHPDRVFMALIAGWGESGEGSDGRTALEWLERLEPPSLAVAIEAPPRAAFTSYVPVNDSANPISKGKALAPMGSMPIGRNRQPRQYPAVVPADPKFYLVWPDNDAPDNLRPALERLCGQVTYLGHSSTPVKMWIENAPIKPNLIPTDGSAPYRMRVFGRGRMATLKARFDAGLRPQPSHWAGYKDAETKPEGPEQAGPFDPGLIVLRTIGGRRWSLESCGTIAKALRDTLMKRWTDTHGTIPPEWLSGHDPAKQPSRQHRPAILPLGFVGSEYADGHLLGIAVAIPNQFGIQNANLLYSLFQVPEEDTRKDRRAKYDLPPDHPFVGLYFRNPMDQSPAGEFDLELDERPNDDRPFTLRAATWTGLTRPDGATAPSRLWATATPIMLPKFPRRELTPEHVVAEACRQAGYPEPVAILATGAPFLQGVPHARSFAVKRQDGRPFRRLVHAKIEFPQPVRGPILVGAGRYNGYGMCRPLPGWEDNP